MSNQKTNHEYRLEKNQLDKRRSALLKVYSTLADDGEHKLAKEVDKELIRISRRYNKIILILHSREVNGMKSGARIAHFAFKKKDANV